MTVRIDINWHQVFTIASFLYICHTNLFSYGIYCI